MTTQDRDVGPEESPEQARGSSGTQPARLLRIDGERRRTGPKSPRGKARARMNAVRHGLTATVAVIPGVEKVGDWRAHRAGVLDNLAPVGHVETLLAERVAFLLWRLHRVAAYERAAIVEKQEQLDRERQARLVRENPDGADPPQHFAYALESTERRLRLLSDLTFGRTMPDETSLTSGDAVEILRAAAHEAGGLEWQDLRVPGLPDGVALDSFTGWTAGLVREAAIALAAKVGKPRTDLLDAAYMRAAEESITMKALESDSAAARDRPPRAHVLPDPEKLDRIMRYEAHLNRQVVQILHELEALQARRRGERTPLARLDVDGLPAAK